MFGLGRLVGRAINRLEPHRHLTYLVPGLSELEINYVNTQTQLLLNLDLESFSRTYPEFGLMSPANNEKIMTLRLHALMDLCEIKDMKVRQHLLKIVLRWKNREDSSVLAHLHNFSRRLLFWAHNSSDMNELLLLMSKRRNYHVLNRGLYRARNYTSLRTLIYDDDRLNQMRNTYITNKLLHGPNEDESLLFGGLLYSLKGIQHSLETLIQLNIVDRLLFDKLQPDMKSRLLLRKGFVIKMLCSPVFTAYLPMPIYYRILEQLQFSNQEISQLLCFSRPQLLENLSLLVRNTEHWNLREVVQELSARKQSVESIKARLANGFTHYDLFIYLIYYSKVMRVANSKTGRFRYQTTPWLDFKFIVDPGNRSIRTNFFNYNVYLDGLTARIGGHLGAKRVIRAIVLSRTSLKENILVNLTYLEAEGFTPEQIGNGAEILLYEPSKLMTFMSQMDSRDMDKIWQRNLKALAFLCYYIEAADNFPMRERNRFQKICPFKLKKENDTVVAEKTKIEAEILALQKNKWVELIKQCEWKKSRNLNKWAINQNKLKKLIKQNNISKKMIEQNNESTDLLIKQNSES